MQAPPNLSRMTREEVEAFARAAALRIEEAENRAAEAERRAADLERRVAQLEALLREPPKSSGNSSLPPSKDFKANKKATERSGPRQGSLGREGSHRRLCENPDEIVRVMAKRCGRCQAELGETEQTFKWAWDKVDIPRVKAVVTRVEIDEGRCPVPPGADETGLRAGGLRTRFAVQPQHRGAGALSARHLRTSASSGWRACSAICSAF